MVEAIIGNVNHLSTFESLHCSCETTVSSGVKLFADRKSETSRKNSLYQKKKDRAISDPVFVIKLL
jgi:hypothetical protein